MALVDEIREGAAWVAGQARHVVVERDAIAEYAAALPPLAELPTLDAEAHVVDGPAELRAAFFLTLDAINFGSGWFPTLRKVAGKSGFWTVEAGLRAHGPWPADALAAMTPEEIAAIRSVLIARNCSLVSAPWPERKWSASAQATV